MNDKLINSSNLSVKKSIPIVLFVLNRLSISFANLQRQRLFEYFNIQRKNNAGRLKPKYFSSGEEA